jgi:hypothetical protein
MVAPTPPSPEAKTTGNVLKWIGIGCGGLLVLAIAGIAGMFFLAKQFLNLSFDSQKAEQTASSIMDYQIPGGGRGIMSMNVSGVEMAGVMSANNPESATLVLGKIPPAMQGSSAEFQESFQRSLNEQQGSTFREISTTTETRSLCGQSVTLTMTEGEQTSPGSNTAVPAFTYQTSVTHNDNLLFVSLTTSGADAKAIADQVFSSLNCK